MKRVMYALYIFLIVIVLIPKEKLYYTIESLLADNHVYLTGESVINRFVYLDVENVQVVLDNLDVATIENIRFTPWIFFNRLIISSVEVSPNYRTFFSGKIDRIELSYSLFHPLSVQIHADGDFGQCNGAVDLISEKVRVVFDATPQLRNYPLLVYKLHREQEGLVYESDF